MIKKNLFLLNSKEQFDRVEIQEILKKVKYLAIKKSGEESKRYEIFNYLGDIKMYYKRIKKRK